MSEPIAVAFVEVRPDTSEFRTNAERELSAGLDRDVEVRGRVELDGVTNARREIDSLRSGLGNLGQGQQLQFQGLESATRDAQLLTQQLQEVARRRRGEAGHAVPAEPRAAARRPRRSRRSGPTRTVPLRA